MENREERPPERPGQRLVYVDMAKCVMLMFVIVSHTEAWRLELPVDPILISTFWICSGYTSGPSVSLRRKATGLLVPYFAMSALCLLFSWLVAGRDIVSRDILGILYSRYVALAAPASETNPCLMPLCNSPLWFLTSLFTGFCVYASLMRIRTLRTQTLAAGLCLALAWAATYLPVLLPWSIDTALFAGPMIWARHQMRRFNVLESLWKLKWRLAACIALYAAFAWLQGWGNVSVREYGRWWPVPVLSSLTGVPALMLLCKAFEHSLAARLLSAINRQALYIFGMQMMFINLVPRHLPFMDGWPQTLAAALLLSICGGWATGRAMSWLTRLVSCRCGKTR